MSRKDGRACVSAVCGARMTVEEAIGKNIMISGNWHWIPAIVEMVELAA